MKIAIVCNLKDKAAGNSEYFEEFDTPETIEAISEVLSKYGHQSLCLEINAKTINSIIGNKVDFVINLAEGYTGRSRESHVPALLEILDIPYSGSDPVTLGVALDKILAKKIARYAGIKTPDYTIVRDKKDIVSADKGLTYPLITKPSWEGSSKGIYDKSKSINREEIKENLLYLLDKYPHQPILVEEYIKGKEVTVGVLGNEEPQILGMMEISGKDTCTDDFFYSLEVKRDWEKLVDYIVPPRLKPSLENTIKEYALLLFKEFNCRDIARVDFKIANGNEIFFLEINPLPGLSPKYSDLVIMSRKYGLSYEELISRILSCSFSRYGYDFNIVDRNNYAKI